MMTVFSQVKISPVSMKRKIAEALVALLSDLRQIKYVSFDKVKIQASDFDDHQIPGIQIIDVTETIEHEQARAKKTWTLDIEIVLKSNEFGEVNQLDLWDLMYQIERKLWAEPNLGIAGMLHIKYISNQTDLHLIEPYYTARLTLEAHYYEHLVRDC